MPHVRAAGTRFGASVVALAIGLTAVVGVSSARGAVAEPASPATVGVAPSAAAPAPGWRREMLASINAVRARAGVPPLKPCPALRRSAQDYAMLMATRDHYGHVGPDGSQPGERMLREGYRWRAFAENIAAGQRGVAAVMADWVASPGHYANLVNPAYRHVGLGHAASEAGGYSDYWVQDFGRGRGC